MDSVLCLTGCMASGMFRAKADVSHGSGLRKLFKWTLAGFRRQGGCDALETPGTGTGEQTLGPTTEDLDLGRVPQ